MTADPFTQPGDAAQPAPGKTTREVLEKHENTGFRDPFTTRPADGQEPVQLDGGPETDGDQDDGSDGPAAQDGQGDGGQESEEQLPEHFVAGSGMPGDPMHEGISN